MSRRRKLFSVGFAALTGAALFVTAGGAAADDGRERTVLRIVTVQAEDSGCPRHQGATSDTRPADQTDAEADAL